MSSLASTDEKPLPIFQQVARGNSARGDDEYPVSAFAAAGRGPAVRTWHRHLSRDGSVLVEPVRSAVFRPDPKASGLSSFVLELALAPGRGIRKDQW